MSGERVGSGKNNAKYESGVNIDEVKQMASPKFSYEINEKKSKDAKKMAMEQIYGNNNSTNNVDPPESQQVTQEQAWSGLAQALTKTVNNAPKSQNQNTITINHDQDEQPPAPQQSPESQQDAAKGSNEESYNLEKLSDRELRALISSTATDLKKSTLGTNAHEKLSEKFNTLINEDARRSATISNETSNQTTPNDNLARVQDNDNNNMPQQQPVSTPVANNIKNQVPPQANNGIKSAATTEKLDTDHEKERTSLINRIKKNKMFKGVVIGALALALAFGAVAGIKMGANAQPQDNISYKPVIESVQTHEDQNTIKVGSPDSYKNYFANEDGTKYNDNKTHQVSFAGANVLGDVRGDIQASKDGVKNVSKQVETLAGYVAALSDQDRIDLGFNSNDTLQQINQKLESDSDFCEQVYDKFTRLVDDSVVTYETLASGSYDNLYMDFIDSDLGANKDNIKVVVCTTPENGTPVTVLRIHDTMLVLKDGCAQPVKAKGQWGDMVNGTSEIAPPAPTPQPEPQPQPEPEPKPWGKSGDTHAGDGEFNKDKVNPDTEVTEWQSDHANDGNKGGQTGTDTGEVDHSGNVKQRDNPDRGVDHSDTEEEQRVQKGDF